MTSAEEIKRRIDDDIVRNVGRVVEISKHQGLGEMLLVFHWFHCTRSLLEPNDDPEQRLPRHHQILINTLADAFKYIIQMIYKYGKKGFVKSVKTGLLMNNDAVSNLIQTTNKLNSTYELSSLIQFFPNATLQEDNATVRVELSALDKDSLLQKLFTYCARIEQDNEQESAKVQGYRAWFERFIDAYGDKRELFKDSMGVDLDSFVTCLSGILGLVQERLKTEIALLPSMQEGTIDVQAYGNILKICRAFLVRMQDVKDKFGNVADKVVSGLTLEKDAIDDNQLMYFQVSRRPILRYGDTLLVSPELILDSLFVNTHYSILENESAKDEYKASDSDAFLNKIVAVSNKFGYTESKRNIDLFDGKTLIGDIDLVLLDAKGNGLFVEAKNHSLPNDVFFHRLEPLKKHLVNLQETWEKKVKRRQEFIRVNHVKYGLPASHKYIVISKRPEVISHFSTVLVLSLDEFERCLASCGVDHTFDEIHTLLYQETEGSFDGMQSVLEELNPGVRFAKD